VTTVQQPEHWFLARKRLVTGGLLCLLPLLLFIDVVGGIGVTTLGLIAVSIGPYELAVGLYAAATMALAGTVWAAARGVQSAQRAERARVSRLVHDTALQSLEAMSLRSAADTIAPATKLAELRASAQAEAARLRRALLGDTNERGGLPAGLEAVVDEATVRGLRVELAAADVSAVRVSQARRAALCGATRTALNNVLRHARVTEAVVRVEPADKGVRVVVRDHGRGFRAEEDRFGYGIRESIRGRLVEVGGRAEVHSAPGRGTRVTLWVPA
jgi:signal transduction histidine kinase